MNTERHGFGMGKMLVGCVLFLVIAAGTVMAQTEEGIKAAFLYNYAKYTEWPVRVFADANSPITVGFVGADALADMFEKNVVGKNANGRDFAVKKLSGAAGAESCQIVYVGDVSQTAAVLGALKGKPVLTVGESDEFAAGGGMIRFVREGAKVTFDLFLDVTKAVGLGLDQKLRQIAKSVKGG